MEGLKIELEIGMHVTFSDAQYGVVCLNEKGSLVILKAPNLLGRQDEVFLSFYPDHIKDWESPNKIMFVSSDEDGKDIIWDSRVLQEA